MRKNYNWHSSNLNSVYCLHKNNFKIYKLIIQTGHFKKFLQLKGVYQIISATILILN